MEPVREHTVSIEIPVVDQISLSDIITNPLRKEKKINILIKKKKY